MPGLIAALCESAKLETTYLHGITPSKTKDEKKSFRRKVYAVQHLIVKEHSEAEKHPLVGGSIFL